MSTSPAGRRTVIIAPPPTPNGDLHVGHMAGPYLACDVYARYLRAAGRPVIYTTGTDDSQTYVVASARRAGTTPEELAARCWNQIRDTLDAAGVAVDGFAPFDDGYRKTVLDFVGALHAAGRFKLRTVRLPYVVATGEYLMEGLVAGDCPVCLLESRGGLCESCGHPNNFDDLIGARSTTDPTAEVAYREVEILVLPMEEYRGRLAAYYAANRTRFRPHMLQLIDEALSRPLPDFPVTYPTPWGIPAPFPETPGQTINAWVEGMPASMYCTWWAAKEMGERAESFDEQWLAENDIALVYFLGFDNAYFWGMTHLALLMAHGDRYVVPDAIVCNEFYELENEKFSTSRGHVVWTRDLVAEVPRDLVHFYLALTAPEHSRTNFSRAGLDKLVAERLVKPWNRLADRVDELGAGLDGEARLEVTQTGREQADIIVDRFSRSYELESFSLHRAADAIMTYVDRVTKQAAAPGDVLLAARTLLACASPILADAGDQAKADGVELAITTRSTVKEIAPFRLPRMRVSVSAVVGENVPAVTGAR
ncbi:class I tRNA ligase family protein [Hamadaea tsunoensis]|uniref:class I tRNA ligase family protein n=1 Tax=Hamadaea tsunoensis TaxID=53368 RepID=UPI0003FF08DE|nr:class I tRNA ligase family protein [Hamadaea tsunoensis]